MQLCTLIELQYVILNLGASQIYKVCVSNFNVDTVEIVHVLIVKWKTSSLPISFDGFIFGRFHAKIVPKVTWTLDPA